MPHDARRAPLQPRDHSGPVVARLFHRLLGARLPRRLALARRAGPRAHRQPRPPAGRRRSSRAPRQQLSFADFPTLFWLGVDRQHAHRSASSPASRSRSSALLGRAPRACAAACRSLLYLSFATAGAHLPQLPVGQPAPRVRLLRHLPAARSPRAVDAHALPPDPLQALLGVGHRQVAVAPARLAGRQRHDLLLRDRAAADARSPGTSHHAPVVVAPPRELGHARLRARAAVRHLRRPAPRAPRLRRHPHRLPDRQRRHRQLRLLLLPRRGAARLPPRRRRRRARARLAARAPAPAARARPSPTRPAAAPRWPAIVLLAVFVVVSARRRARQLRRRAGAVRRAPAGRAASARRSASSTPTTCSATSRARASSPNSRPPTTAPPGSRTNLRHKAGDPARRPDWVAPHQPRVDFQLWFYGLSYARGAPEYVTTLLERLCRDPAAVQPLFRAPLPSPHPRAARIVYWQYHFTTAAERRATGAWWTREPVDVTDAVPCDTHFPESNPSTTSDPAHERFRARLPYPVAMKRIAPYL